MGYLSEKEYATRLKRVQMDNESKERKRKLREEKNKFRPKIKLPSTSKLVLLVVILLCLEIVFFCQYVMIEFGDTSALYTLIGIPVTLVPTIWGYYSKSKAENTAGGIVFEQAMMQLNQENSNEDLSGIDDANAVG